MRYELLLQLLDNIIGNMGRLVSVNAQDGHERTPLHWAAEKKGNEEVVRLLIESGASVNTCDGKTRAAFPHVATIQKWGV